jgi:S-(hydroxymethyl)glutathione dehydrogenase / alcohol dehydrogenase
MRAAVCHAFGAPLVVEEVVLEPPGRGEVAVQLAACAVCHSDLSYLDGAWGGALPAVYGHEAAGVVDELGPGVTAVRAGDCVVVTAVRSCGGCFFCARDEPALCEAAFADGRLRSRDGTRIEQGLRTAGFAEQVVVHESQLVVVPADVPLECAALLACGVMTGFGAVTHSAGVRAGESVVVIGTGGVGLNCVQAAALAGAEPVVAVDLSHEKLGAARAFGATHTLDPRGEDAVAAVRALTGGRGADRVLVATGSRSAIEGGLGLVRRGGSLVVVGIPASGVSVAFDANELADGSRRILGSKFGSASPRRDVPQLVELYREGRLKLDELISGRYRLDDVNEAVASAREERTLRNVIVLDGA